MKKFLQLLIVITSILSIQSCNTDQDKVLPGSQGALYEMFVVCSQEKWDGEIGDTLRAILAEPVPMLNQIEPHFDLLRINPEAYTNLVPRHRNQLVVNTGKKYETPSINIQYDVYADPQIIVTASAANDSILTDYLWQSRKELLQVFMMAERDRNIKINERYFVNQIRKDVEAKFNFSIKVPQGYIIAKDAENFMWLTNEQPLTSSGIVIYEYPYKTSNDLRLDNIVAMRNKYTALVPGQIDGSYMITAEIEPDIRYMKVHNRPWAEVRGFWDLKNDFFGGPFISFTTVDKERQKVICIDCFVSAPGKNKRNLIRQLENLIYTVSFPDNLTPATTTDTIKTK